MSSGIPVVVTDQMGPKEIVQDGKTGFIASGTEEFGERTSRLITDTRLRKKMGANARAYALTRTWDAIFGGLFDLYKEYAQ